MSTTPQNVLQLARQGNPDAIAALMNRHLEAQGITAQVVQQESTLHVSLESAQVPSQADLVAYVKKGISGLELAHVQHLTISAQQLGHDSPAWSEDLALQPLPPVIEAVETPSDLGLDFDLDTAGPGMENDDYLDLEAALDNGLGGTDLDFDLGLTDNASADLDASSDFDLSFADNSSDFGLDFTDQGSVPEPVSDLDFDLGLTDSASADLDASSDFDLSFADNSSDFDLGLADESPADASAADLDFDLDFTPTPAETSATTDLDFDLGFADQPPATDPAADLDFDLDFADDPTMVTPGGDLDFDLGFTDQVAESTENLGVADASSDALADDALENDPLDFDLGVDDDTADLDLGFMAEESAMPFDLTSDQGDLDLDRELEALDVSLDADLEDDGASAFDLDLTELPELNDPADAIAADLADFDLTSEASGSSDRVASELDDLWGSDPADAELPDLGTPSSDLPAEGTANLWETDTDLSFLDDGTVFAENLATDAELAAADFNAGDFDLGTTAESFDSESLGSGAIAPDEGGFPDLGLDSETANLDFETGLEDLPSALFVPEDLAFEDLGAAAALDQQPTPGDDWTPTDPGFEPDDQLSGYDSLAAEEVSAPELDWTATDLTSVELAPEELGLQDLGTDQLSGYDPLDPEAVSAPNLDWTVTDLTSVELASEDLGQNLDYEDLGYEDLATEDLGYENLGTEDLGFEDGGVEDLTADVDPAWTADTDFTNTDTTDWSGSSPAAPPWTEPESGFAPDLGLAEPPSDFGAELGDEFDPNLSFDPGAGFDPAAEAVDDAPPNPFAVEAFPLEDGTIDTYELENGESEPEGFGAEADFPFDATPELDPSGADDFLPLGDLPEESGSMAFDEDDATFGQPGMFADEAFPVDMGFESDEDLAFESVEFDPGESGVLGQAEGFDDEGLGVGLGSASLDNESFDNESFDADLFSDSAGDSNGFLQDRNGVGPVDDAPDAADDFIQEFGTDPSTHVALTPDQFAEDGSVRRTGGSGLPLRLILGLGLGAIALALAALLLNSLLKPFRQSSPSDPVVTEPAVPNPGAPAPAPPVDPAAVAEVDLFRQAVNAAQTAANQAQTAQTAAQWQAVADSWSAAIALMQRVPQSDPNYATAQQKAVQYQPNLVYAQQNVQRLQ